MIEQLKHFFFALVESITNYIVIAFGLAISTIAYLIGYPVQNGILIFALVLFVTDIVTRIYAISCNNKGLVNAFLNKKLTSRGFWNGFITKAVGYFVILMIGNLCLQTEQIQPIGQGISYILYIGLAFYEVISNLENLRDAGFVGCVPLLDKLKKNEKDFWDKDGE